MPARRCGKLSPVRPNPVRRPSPAALAAAANRTIPDFLPYPGQHLLAGYGLGITNLVARATAQAAELTPAELTAGGERLRALIAARRSRDLGPRVLAVAGVTAYRAAFGHSRAAIGPQPEPLDDTPVWVLPNPSGLNASWTLPRISEAFGELREATGA